jgi:hypothetical protein
VYSPNCLLSSGAILSLAFLGVISTLQEVQYATGTFFAVLAGVVLGSGLGVSIVGFGVSWGLGWFSTVPRYLQLIVHPHLWMHV